MPTNRQLTSWNRTSRYFGFVSTLCLFAAAEIQITSAMRVARDVFFQNGISADLLRSRPAVSDCENARPRRWRGCGWALEAQRIETAYNSSRRRRSAFIITENELNVIAALAIMGLSSRPNHG